jgi:putative ABC transport system permease protein
MYTRLLEMMAAIALFLATIGIYGVISHSVVQRSSEIGLRIAVGATQRDILRLIFSQAGMLILAGFCIALVLAFVLNRYLASYLFEIRATDPMTIVACCVLLGAVAFGAVWFPAHRATRVDPIVTLHYE